MNFKSKYVKLIALAIVLIVVIFGFKLINNPMKNFEGKTYELYTGYAIANGRVDIEKNTPSYESIKEDTDGKITFGTNKTISIVNSDDETENLKVTIKGQYMTFPDLDDESETRYIDLKSKKMAGNRTVYACYFKPNHKEFYGWLYDISK